MLSFVMPAAAESALSETAADVVSSVDELLDADEQPAKRTAAAVSAAVRILLNFKVIPLSK
jgi:hypothetical protein